MGNTREAIGFVVWYPGGPPYHSMDAFLCRHEESDSLVMCFSVWNALVFETVEEARKALDAVPYGGIGRGPGVRAATLPRQQPGTRPARHGAAATGNAFGGLPAATVPQLVVILVAIIRSSPQLHVKSDTTSPSGRARHTHGGRHATFRLHAH